MLPTRKIIRKFHTPAKLGISKATLALWLNPDSRYFKADLPKELGLGENSKGFFEDELDTWLENRIKPTKDPVQKLGVKHHE